MATQQEQYVTGFVPGGEDRTQWIFEGDRGEVWTDEMMKSIIDQVTEFVAWYRERYGSSVGDMVSYFRFSFMQDAWNNDNRMYFITRRHWRYDVHALSYDGIVEKLKEVIEQDKNWKISFSQKGQQ